MKMTWEFLYNILLHEFITHIKEKLSSEDIDEIGECIVVVRLIKRESERLRTKTVEELREEYIKIFGSDPCT